MSGVRGAARPEGWLNEGIVFALNGIDALDKAYISVSYRAGNWKTLVIDIGEFHMPQDSEV